ncbi:aspartate-semialdehyde dehydrogenase [Actibacterium pelagium]|uniref:Aspartate-semialdehyde dehydrogenase n=1 Tax=Actibacterium pelagium TaxID=2029103 RepID=A0A917AHF6_9RHOB|nr:aspartate-semialdehyde dehydrogenase [Actibacterium pelagium]GGE51858.1 aspartate-semialdehyde dehydrogenase [Actibacterium pelagium]
MLDQNPPAQLPANPNVAIVGSTGAVGVELLNTLAARGFPLANLKLLASARSAGKEVSFNGGTLIVEELSENSFDDVHVAFFSAGATLSRKFAPIAVAAGALVVDNSSAFRMDPDVPLVVPEANAAAMSGHAGVVANPNCVAAIATVALAPLHKAFNIQRLNLATYQAASGAGAAAMEELRQGTQAYLNGDDFQPEVLPHPYAFNFFSHNADIEDNGYNGEENKVIAEVRRIMERPALPIGVTCIRVPILRAHGMAISIEFDQPVSPEQARALLQDAPGVKLVDDREANYFPMPVDASGQEDVLVGRIREDLGDPSGRSLSIFVVGDQLLKGAALNAVQIAEQFLPA